jgi:hypothetical protein
MLKTYGIYIKSHDHAPDYEREVEAESKEEAARLFMTPMMAEAGYDPEMLLEYIEEI